MSPTTTSTSRSAAETSPSLRRTRPRYGEATIKVVLFTAALVSVATTLGIVVSLIPPTLRFFEQVGLVEFFTSTEWTPLFSKDQQQYGVLPLVSATLLITAVAVVVAVPLGLAAAVYLSEYARPAVRKTFKPVLEVLAGIPTVVYGFFALTFITPLLKDIWPGGGEGPDIFNGLSAGLVMGVMIIPTVASLSEDAMAAVPQSLRQGAYALGSTPRVVALRVVVPAAVSGIIAAVVLAISRAVGETMIVAVAAGLRPNLTGNLLEPMQTMTAYIAAAGSGDVPTASFDYTTIFAVGALLFVMTFVMNVISIRMVRRFREVYE